MEEVEKVLAKHVLMKWHVEAHCSCGWMHEVPHRRNGVGHGDHLSEMLKPLFAEAFDEGFQDGYTLASDFEEWEEFEHSNEGTGEVLYINPYREEG